jgi:predicted nucleotidyltransferase
MKITDEIRFKLTEIEQAHGIKILYACESGSRAWGFESNDSDYDVRFFFTYDPMAYFTMDKKSIPQVLDSNNIMTHMEFPLDFAGWDIHKALELMLKGNVTPAEWINCPIVYKDNPTFRVLFQEMVKHHFKRVPGYYHYSSMAKADFNDIDMTMKKLLYTFRATLAAQWCRLGIMPPVDMRDLASTFMVCPHVDKAYLSPNEVFTELKEFKLNYPEKKKLDRIVFAEELEHIQLWYEEMQNNPPTKELEKSLELDNNPYHLPRYTEAPMTVDQFLKFSIFSA